jgi:hypothetical protein
MTLNKANSKVSTLRSLVGGVAMQRMGVSEPEVPEKVNVIGTRLSTLDLT